MSQIDAQILKAAAQILQAVQGLQRMAKTEKHARIAQEAVTTAGHMFTHTERMAQAAQQRRDAQGAE